MKTRITEIGELFWKSCRLDFTWKQRRNRLTIFGHALSADYAEMLGSVICVACRGVQARNELWFELQSCLEPRWEYMKGASLWTGFLSGPETGWTSSAQTLNRDLWSRLTGCWTFVLPVSLDKCLAFIIMACLYHSSLLWIFSISCYSINFKLVYFSKSREKFFFINHLRLNIFLKKMTFENYLISKRNIYLHIYEFLPV